MSKRTCAELDQGGKVARRSRRWCLGDRLIVACSATRKRRANVPFTPLMASDANSQSNASLKAPCATASTASSASTVPLAVSRWTPHAAALHG
ncbi:MAG: hypothetical protein Q8R44_05285 [Novosphingobium sp.]|nr:hypothetical protein [Novosphingobium sp.]